MEFLKLYSSRFVDVGYPENRLQGRAGIRQTDSNSKRISILATFVKFTD